MHWYAAGSDYIAVEKILSLPIWSGTGDKTCFDVQIIDDTIIEETEQFVIHFLVHDLNVDVPMAYARADVNITDDDVPKGKYPHHKICDHTIIIEL